MTEVIRIHEVTDHADRAACAAYIAAHPASTYSGTPAWTDVITGHYGFPARTVLARSGDAIRGALTLVVNGRHALTSPLASSGGGLLADSPEVIALLLEDARGFAQAENLDYVQLRLIAPIEAEGWITRDGYSRFVLDLSGGADHIWGTTFRDKTRNQVRKAQACDFEVAVGHAARDEFIDVLQRGTRELGAPAPGPALFDRAITAFGEDVTFVVVRGEGRPIAGAALFVHADTISNPWAVALRAWRPTSVNSLLYWACIEEGCRLGCTAFDMGRSERNSGTWHFKRRLGATEEPLHYYYLCHRASCPPSPVPSGAAANFIRACWRRTPQFVTRRLGDRLLKELI